MQKELKAEALKACNAIVKGQPANTGHVWWAQSVSRVRRMCSGPDGVRGVDLPDAIQGDAGLRRKAVRWRSSIWPQSSHSKDSLTEDDIDRARMQKLKTRQRI
jgi:hypothetical protein